jgi:starch phosphorylase
VSVIENYVPRVRIAYFTMEIALRPEMHTYSGGLGVLAGDAARSAADLDLPMVFVTLASRQGYLRQEIDSGGWQADRGDPWEPADWAMPLPATVSISIEGRDVRVRPWIYELASPAGNKVPVILLDTFVDGNDPADCAITDRLYGGGQADRLKQEIVLGIGGERVLQALGFAVETYHLNEGHAALLPVALLRRHHQDSSGRAPDAKLYDPEPVRRQCVFTTHTPVEAGHDRFNYEDVARILGDIIERDLLKKLAGDDHLNMTRLALNLSGYVNAVSERHAETTRQMFPDYRIHAITNGVHPGRWMHSAFAQLFDRAMPDWMRNPGLLSQASDVEDDAIWSAHMQAKHDLVDLVREQTGVQFAPELPVIGFARRMTAYKRAGLLFSDLSRLREIYGRFPFQIVIAGKAHPQDEGGKALIRDIVGHAHRADIPLAFIPGYDMDLARTVVSGSDVWLNTPLPPLEASGTSGMKAALNGVLNLSILDGWWIEACDEGINGWRIDHSPEGGPDARALYEKLESVVLPLYTQDRTGWIRMMKRAIGTIGPVFNSHRMMLHYAREAYSL